MALSQCHVLTKSSHKLLPLSYNLIAKCISRNTPDKSLTIEADAFDDFTTQLVQRHISKWESIQARKKQTVAPKLDTICSPPSSCHLKNDDLCTKLLAVVENSDFRNVNAIIKTCAEVEYCPDTKLTMDILSLCGQSGNHTAILDLKHLYQKYNSQFLQENANFDVYLAEALWVAGRIIKALNLFDDLYRNNTSLRRHARSIIKNLILNARVNPSEAESLNIIKFCERVYTEHNDLYLLATMCQMCFLSEWYCDQKTSIELLDKNSELLKLMLNRFPYLISVALANHQTDIVYILLEFLLKKKLRAEYSNVLKCLFTYKGKSVLTILGMIFLIF